MLFVGRGLPPQEEERLCSVALVAVEVEVGAWAVCRRKPSLNASLKKNIWGMDH